MTTVIYKDGLLMADTLTQVRDMECHHCKLHRCEITKSVFGGSGVRWEILNFMKWFREGADMEKAPEFPEEHGLGMLELTKDGRLLFWDKTLTPIEIFEEYFAVGCGGAFAIGAMAMGATITQAMAVAEKMNIDTGGPFHVCRPGGHIEEVWESNMPQKETQNDR